MKQIPFDLTRALAGDKVVTRDGHEVTQLTNFSDSKVKYRVVGVLEQILFSWDENGVFLLDSESNNDLFMAPKTVKRWVNFYGTQKAYHYDSEIKAKQCAESDAIAIAVPVEFEEGYGCE